MPALRKPHRVAFLLPDVRIEGSDLSLAHEVGLVMWMACIEACQRHPALAVYDAESTPLVPIAAHFSPQAATIGATPTDTFYAPTRRDELVWLQLALPKAGLVRLHTLGRDGKRASFEAIGKNLGDQIDHVIGAWLAGRSLGPLPQRFPSVTAEEVIATTKPIAPVLVEQARAWALPGQTWVFETGGDEDVGALDDAADLMPEALLDLVPPAAGRTRPIIARPVANRVPQTPLRVAALRVLALALREDLDELILAADPAQPQALFATFRASGRDYALLRRIIASAPCWAQPYGELVRSRDRREGAPSELETVAGAGIAALARPQHLELLERVAELLEECGLVDEGVRLLERSLASHDHEARAHLALLRQLRETDREGNWLARASRSSRIHGCSMDPEAYADPEQILMDLALADALLGVGRFEEAIALRARRLEAREASWPRHTHILATWRKHPRFVARSYAREGAFRGDPVRVVDGFGCVAPADEVDLAMFLDALVATGREAEVGLAWSEFGLGRGRIGPVARLAAARGLLAAGEWRRGLEEMWRIELTEPGRDEHVAVARCGLLLSAAPLEVAEAAIGERVAIGATSLARRMARDVADFMPGAASSSVIMRALGKLTNVELDPNTLTGFSVDGRGKQAIDAMFADLGAKGAEDVLARSDRLVNQWLEVVFTEASEDDPTALARAAAYVAANALGRYLAMTTGAATPLAGALRTVAGEALALVRTHHAALSDRDARAVFGVIEPLLRRVDRWIGSAWVGTVERSLGIDERAGGDVAGFAGQSVTIAARILGPEEFAVLAASVARLHRDRPTNWAGAVVAQATQLALHTGYLGADEWADAVAAQVAAQEIDLDDAIDELHTTAYLVEGVSAGPAVHAARILLDAGRGSAALAMLAVGLGAADEAWRDLNVPGLAVGWAKLNLDVPFDITTATATMALALLAEDAARAERIGRWVIAFDPRNAEAQRTLGLALAHQGKIAEALEHLVRATPEQGTQILADALHQAGKATEAMAVFEYASRWYTRSAQWLAFGGAASAAMDTVRTVRAYRIAYQLDADAFDASQLDSYAGVLDTVGDHLACELVATHLLRVAGDDPMWKTSAQDHLACALIGQARYIEAEAHAQAAVANNPLPDNTVRFATTLDRARTKTRTTPEVIAPITPLAGTWLARRLELEASRFRDASENAVPVTARALTTATAVLAATTGQVDRDAMIARSAALQIREQAYFARDPVPQLGERMTRDAFYQAFRSRGGVVIGEATPLPPPFKDRVVVPGSPIARISDYIALIRDLAALAPREAIAQFDLDEVGYLAVANAWAAAIAADPSLAPAISAGLAKS